jgi:hypothetical protein
MRAIPANSEGNGRFGIVVACVFVLACDAAYVGPPKIGSVGGDGPNGGTSSWTSNDSGGTFVVPNTSGGATGQGGLTANLGASGTVDGSGRTAYPVGGTADQGGAIASTASGGTLGSGGSSATFGAGGTTALGSSGASAFPVGGTTSQGGATASSATLGGTWGVGGSSTAITVLGGTWGVGGSSTAITVLGGTWGVGGSSTTIGSGGTTALGGASTASSSAGTGGTIPVTRHWPEEPPRGTRIPVCWSTNAANGKTIEDTPIANTSSQDAATLRRWVREAVDNTWGRFADITFVSVATPSDLTDWAPCSSLSPFNTIQLNFTTGDEFADRGPKDNAPTRIRLHIPADDPSAVAAAAVRTFGQALGILPALHSGLLTPLDIVTAQTVYGRKHGGAWVGWGGRCMNVSGVPEFIDWDVDVVVSDCASIAHQRWRPYLVPGQQEWTLRVSHQFYGHCLRAIGSDKRIVTGGTTAKYLSQTQLTNMQWKGWGDLCVTASSAESGATLALQSCDDSVTQRWDLFANTIAQIRLTSTDLCVAAVTDVDSATPTSLRLGKCNPEDRSQSFDLSAHDLVRYDENACLQARGEPGSAGATLTIATTCNPSALEQLFHISGAVSLPDDDGCLSVNDGNSYDGAITQVRPCSPSTQPIAAVPERQVWDHYW